MRDTTAAPSDQRDDTGPAGSRPMAAGGDDVTETPAGAERRAAPRFAYSGIALFECGDDRRGVEPTTLSVSGFGCVVPAEVAPPLRQETIVVLVTNTDALRLPARVVRRQHLDDGTVVGLQFHDLAHDQVDRLHAIVASLADAARRSPPRGP